MSLKNSYVTSDYIEWDTMLSLVRKLYRDKEYRLSLLIGCGSFFGLRISDLLTLTWSMLLDSHSFVIIEKKTGKRREIKVNTNFQKHIADCYAALKIMDKKMFMQYPVILLILMQVRICMLMGVIISMMSCMNMKL